MSVGRRIAIIDDDNSILAALAAMLRSAGLVAQTHESGDIFLAQYAPGQFDCVVTDLQMPGLSGMALVAHICRLEAAPPVVVITAQSRAGLEDEARAAGAKALFRKPFDGDVLIAAIEALIAR